MNFRRLRNDSNKAQMHVYLAQSSKAMHMNPDMFGLSNTKHLRRNAVLHRDDDVASLPTHDLMIW